MIVCIHEEEEEDEWIAVDEKVGMAKGKKTCVRGGGG